MCWSTAINMILTVLGLIFSGICAYCALKTLPDKKKEIEAIKNEIIEYRDNIIEKQDLVMLIPKNEIIKEQSDIFSKISTHKIPEQGDEKSEIDYYGDIKECINTVLNDIPETYKETRELLDDIIRALNYCIGDEKTFNELNRECEFSYSYVEIKFSRVIAKINTLIREIKY